MKKTLLLFVVVISVLFMPSCRHREAYDFMNSTDSIERISIVELTINMDGGLTETELQAIVDINAFLEDFGSVNCYTYFGDPVGITPGEKGVSVIKITYDNGEYELIDWKGQAEFNPEKGFKNYVGFCVFDEEQFEALITKYSAD